MMRWQRQAKSGAGARGIEAKMSALGVGQRRGQCQAYPVTIGAADSAFEDCGWITKDSWPVVVDGDRQTLPGALDGADSNIAFSVLSGVCHQYFENLFHRASRGVHDNFELPCRGRDDPQRPSVVRETAD